MVSGCNRVTKLYIFSHLVFIVQNSTMNNSLYARSARSQSLHVPLEKSRVITTGALSEGASSERDDGCASVLLLKQPHTHTAAQTTSHSLQLLGSSPPSDKQINGCWGNGRTDRQTDSLPFLMRWHICRLQSSTKSGWGRSLLKYWFNISRHFYSFLNLGNASPG